MAEGTILSTVTGTIVAMSATAPATYDSAGYTSTSITWTTIGKVENVGEHGGEKQITEFIPAVDGVVDKFPGSVNYGALPLTMGYLPSDGGQDLIDTAFGTANRYQIKITFPTRMGESTPEYRYYEVIVQRRVWSEGGANDVRKLSATFAICRNPVRVAAT